MAGRGHGKRIKLDPEIVQENDREDARDDEDVINGQQCDISLVAVSARERCRIKPVSFPG